MTTESWLFVAVVAVIVLAVYAQNVRAEISDLRERFNARVQQEFQLWRGRELKSEAEKSASVLLRQWQIDNEKDIRADAVRRSGATIAGKVSEHFAPYLPGFPFNPKDVRFLGTPIDLVVFDGLNDGTLKRIVFVEIKAGGSTLSTRERAVRDMVQHGAVEWLEHRLDIPTLVEALPPRQALPALRGSEVKKIVSCPTCGQMLRAPLMGARIRCPACRGEFSV